MYSITVEQIQEQMKTSNTCPLIAYYMLRDGVDYPAAVKYYQQHNHHVSLFEQEELADQVGYCPYYNPLRPDEKKRFNFTVKLAQVETELTAEEVKLLLKVDYDGKNFNIPTDEEVKAAYPAANCPNPYDMFKYGWTELQAKAEFKRDMLEQAEQQRHREAIAKIEAQYGRGVRF